MAASEPLSIDDALHDKATMDNFAKNQAEREAAAKKALEDGTWKEIVKKAEDQMIIGEDFTKKALFYSGISSGLKDERLHIFLMGDSQLGKSFIQEKMGTLFPGIFTFASSMSAKSPYAEAEANKDPGFYNHKILGLDELADQSEATRDFVKAATGNKQNKMVNKTLDERRKFNLQSLEGMPILWTNSMEVFKDQGSQLANRFFKMNIDETVEQSERVEEFQKSDAKFGKLKKPQVDKDMAVEIVAAILSEKDFNVLNPFSDLIEQANTRARNALPMFYTLVSSIAYANRFRRPSFTVSGVEKYLIASLADNIEALEIWKHGKWTGLPDSYTEILETMEMGKEYTVDQLTEDHNRKFPKHKLAAKTINNYLSGEGGLAEKNLVTSARPHQALEAYDKGENEGKDKDSKDRRVGYPRGFVYSRLVTSLTSQLAWEANSKQAVETLDAWKNELKKLTSQLPNTTTQEFFEGLKEQLINVKIESDQDKEVAGLRKFIEERKLRITDLERIDPRQRALIERLRRDGRIAVQPNGTLYWAK